MERDQIFKVISYRGCGRFFAKTGLGRQEVWSRRESVNSYPSPAIVQLCGLNETGEPLCASSSKGWSHKYAPLGLLWVLNEMMCINLSALRLAYNMTSNWNFHDCPFPHDLTRSRTQVCGRADSENSRNPRFWVLEMMTQIPSSTLSHKSSKESRALCPILLPRVDGYFHILWDSLSNHTNIFTRKQNFHHVMSFTRLGCWWPFPPLPMLPDPLTINSSEMAHCPHLHLIQMTKGWESQIFGCFRVNLQMPR